MNERITAMVNIIAELILSERGSAEPDDLKLALGARGFMQQEVEETFAWIEQFAALKSKTAPEDDRDNDGMDETGRRVLNDFEKLNMSLAARGLLTRLRDSDLIDDEAFDAILGNASDLGIEETGIDEIRSLTTLWYFYDLPFSTGNRELRLALTNNWERIYH